MSKETIAIVINTSWNIYNFRLGLMNALRDEGFRVVAIAPNDDYVGKMEALGFEHHDIVINNKGTNPLQDLLLTYKFYKLYKKIKADVILHYTIKPNIYGTIAAKFAGIPSINNISGLGTVFINNNLSSKLARFLYRFSLKFSQKVFFQNPHDKQLFIKNKLVNEALADLLPGSGINLDKFQPTALERKQTQPFVFLFIARMIKDKGLIEFVEAAKHVIQNTTQNTNDVKRTVEFWLLGDTYPGNPTAVTEAEINDWQSAGIIKYLGHVDNVADVIKKADCVVLPSYREGLSRVLLEAAALARPIITTDVPGCRDVVEDGVNGFLCEVKNTEDLALKMDKMLKLPGDELVNMGLRGRKKIEREFDEQDVINQYLKTIQYING